MDTIVSTEKDSAALDSGVDVAGTIPIMRPTRWATSAEAVVCTQSVHNKKIRTLYMRTWIMMELQNKPVKVHSTQARTEEQREHFFES